MENNNIVLLFDGIGEIIDERILGRDFEISQMFQEEFEEYRTFIEKEIFKYNKAERHDGIIWDWIKKYIYDYCIYQKWKPDINVSYVLPYSMGLITALVCLDGISFEAGIKIIIASYYYTLNKQEDMLMLMVVGYNKEELQNSIHKHCEENTVFEAADIGHNYILLSGLKKSIDILIPLLIEGGAIKVNPIMAPVAYHTKFAQIYIDEFAKVIDSIEVRDITTPICSLYSNQYINKSCDLKHELVINLYSKMNVTACIEKLKRDGNHVFFEIGATKSLYKIYRRMDEEIQILKNLH